jgi:hypothetical protein
LVLDTLSDAGDDGDGDDAAAEEDAQRKRHFELSDREVCDVGFKAASSRQSWKVAAGATRYRPSEVG